MKVFLGFLLSLVFFELSRDQFFFDLLILEINVFLTLLRVVFFLNCLEINVSFEFLEISDEPYYTAKHVSKSRKKN